MTEHFDILEEIYLETLLMVEEGKLEDISSEIKESINPFIEKIETDKSLVQLIVTTLLKKIVSPEQDIRLHMAKFEGGYSARGLDTEVTTRFFKKYFPKYANKETAFLTKATRTEIIWNFTDGLKLPLRSKKLIPPFLQLIDKIQNGTINLRDSISYIFGKLCLLSKLSQMIFDKVAEASNFYDVININTIIEMLKEHFESRLSSRLPVIAIYSVYHLPFASFMLHF